MTDRFWSPRWPRLSKNSLINVKAGRFLPDGIEGSSEQAESGAAEAMLFPVGRGSRSQDLAGAVRFYLPRILNELISGLDHVIGEQIERLQYLGPLRSYPPRHLAFSEHDDANWRAGGGYAWDVLRRDWIVREQVNKWLGADWLKTNYQLVLRELVAIDQLDKPLSTAFETFEGDDQVLDLEVDYDDTSGQPSGQYPVIKDTDEAVSRIQTCIEMSDIDKLPELSAPHRSPTDGPSDGIRPAPQPERRKPMTRLMMTFAAALVAMVVAAPVAAQSMPGDARIWLEYKGTQVLCADPGMPSTEAAVNVEAFGGFFEPGTDSGLKHARVAFSPADLVEWAAVTIMPRVVSPATKVVVFQ